MENFCVVPEERRYWVIRSERGVYLQHFLQHEFIAIGHLDDLDLNPTNGNPFVGDWPTLRERLIKRFDSLDMKRRGAYAVAAQARAFVEDIKDGDWVLVPGASQIAVGRVTSSAFLDKEVTYSKDELGLDLQMSFNLRRKVIWGPVLWRTELSSPLRRSLVANQTVFNVDDHWEAIYHALYAAFQRGETLYLTAKLTSESAVNNLDITSFLSILSDIEVLSKGIAEGLDTNNFEAYFLRYRAEGLLNLTTKAEFYSPGDIWVQLATQAIPIAGSYSWVPIAVIAYNMLFGNSKKGLDGLIDLQTRQRIWGIFLDRIEKRGAKTAIENMGVTQPNKNVSSLNPPDPNLKSRKGVRDDS